MSLSTADHLDAMLNDIARNHCHLDTEAAAIAIASHIRRFWTPAMIQQLIGQHVSDKDGLEPAAARTIERLQHP